MYVLVEKGNEYLNSSFDQGPYRLRGTNSVLSMSRAPTRTSKVSKKDKNIDRKVKIGSLVFPQQYPTIVHLHHLPMTQSMQVLKSVGGRTLPRPTPDLT